MGRAARWFKGIFGIKKSKERETRVSSGGDSTKGEEDGGGGGGSGGSNFHRKTLQTDPIWLRTYFTETEKEQNKHAIAVAAATAAAADAAVAAAQAAVAVVKLTSNGRTERYRASGNSLERWAALKIQTIFKGYLARKALRALKGLVKLQALVRGYLVRKRAAATLHSMQALIRAQTAARSQRINRNNMFNPRQSIERFDDSRSEIHSKRMSISVEKQINNFNYDETSPKIVEIDTYKTKSRSKKMMNVAVSECGEDLKDFEWSFGGEKCKFQTAQNTPRFSYNTPNNNNYYYAPPSPAKSVCRDACFRPSFGTPSYMANTQSFKAKVRSHSAPRQRPDRKRLSLDEIMAARSSVSGVRMVQQTQQTLQTLQTQQQEEFQDASHFRFYN